MVGRVRSGVGDVVEHLFAVQAVALGDGQQARGSKRAFGVDEETFAFATSVVGWQLARDGQLVAKLGFACSEFTKELCNASCFNATCLKMKENNRIVSTGISHVNARQQRTSKEHVEVGGPGGDHEQVFSAVVKL